MPDIQSLNSIALLQECPLNSFPSLLTGPALDQLSPPPALTITGATRLGTVLFPILHIATRGVLFNSFKNIWRHYHMIISNHMKTLTTFLLQHNKAQFRTLGSLVSTFQAYLQILPYIPTSVNLFHLIWLLPPQQQVLVPLLSIVFCTLFYLLILFKALGSVHVLSFLYNNGVPCTWLYGAHSTYLAISGYSWRAIVVRSLGCF